MKVIFEFLITQVKQLNDFNRKVAMEKELEKTDLLKYNNVAFDKSGNFIAFAGLAGVKVVNIVTDKVVRVLGRPESLRFLQVRLINFETVLEEIENHSLLKYHSYVNLKFS